MNHRHEAAFRNWQTKHRKVLLQHCPEAEGLYGAASNFDHWCRRVYTGRIKLAKELAVIMQQASESQVKLSLYETKTEKG